MHRSARVVVAAFASLLAATLLSWSHAEAASPWIYRGLTLPRHDVALDDLIGFFKDPVKGFFRALDVTLPWDVDSVEDAMPVEIDALAEWQVGERMLDDMLRGLNPEQAQQAEWRRGSLPPGRLGWRKAQELRDQAAALATAA